MIKINILKIISISEIANNPIWKIITCIVNKFCLEKKTKIALNQVFVFKLAFKAKSHKNSTQEMGFRV